MESKRKESFKKSVTSDDGRRRRGETAVQLRKQQREEGLVKRRNVMVNNLVSAEPEVPVQPGDNVFLNNLMKLKSSDVSIQLEGLRAFRKILSIEVNPPVQDCIDIGAVPCFVYFLQRTDCDTLQFEAAWALTNIASTDRTDVVVNSGAIPHLVQQLVSPSADVREQCAWCLGNVAGEGAAYRDIILQAGGLDPLIQNILMPANMTLLRNCVWALSNFCRGKPQPKLDIVLAAYAPLVQILKTCTDQATIIDACWALSYLSDGCNARIQQLIDLDPCHTFVRMLQSNQHQTIVPALRTLGNIVSGDDHQTQAVLDAGVLTAIMPLLSHSKKNIRKEACWTISNIAAGNKTQLSAVVNCPELLLRIINILGDSSEWDVRKEATWVISNIATGGSKYHIFTLVEQGAIAPLCDLLNVKDTKVLMVVMEAIDAILTATINVVPAYHIDTRHLIDEADGISKLEALQEHEHNEVYQKAMGIVEKHFGGEDEESENLAPVNQNQNQMTFGFGVPTKGQENSYNAATQLKQFSFGQQAAPQVNRNLFA